jgi:MFS family permease
MLGQGALSLLSSNTLAMWFHARLGTASGLMSLGTALAFAAVPPTNLFLIERFGWRWAYALLGTAVWAVMLPLLVIFFRDRPEDIGQVPDGELARVPATDKPRGGELYCDLTLEQALRSRAYWILLCAHIVWALVGTAIVFSIVDLFADHGLSKADVAVFFTYFACSMAASQFGGGFLADRFPLPALLLFAMIGMTLSVAYLTRLDGPQSAVAFAIALGASQGLFIVLGQTVWARYFGRANLGKIRGTVWAASVAGSSLGPFTLGVTKDVCGKYTPGIWLFVVMYGILAIAAPFATPPPTRHRFGAAETLEHL